MFLKCLKHVKQNLQILDFPIGSEFDVLQYGHILNLLFLKREATFNPERDKELL